MHAAVIRQLQASRRCKPPPACMQLYYCRCDSSHVYICQLHKDLQQRQSWGLSPFAWECPCR